jgi:hypothetical protein
MRSLAYFALKTAKMIQRPSKTNSFGRHLPHFRKTLTPNSSYSSASEGYPRASSTKAANRALSLTGRSKAALISKQVDSFSSYLQSTVDSSVKTSMYFSRAGVRKSTSTPKNALREAYFFRDVKDDSSMVAKCAAFYRSVRQ